MRYTVRATTSGTAPALAFSKSFAAQHPEFTEGRLEAYVIAPGRLLVTAPLDDAVGDGDDPLLGTFLSFLDDQVRKEPGMLRPFTATDTAGVDELLRGVESNPDEEIDPDFVLP